MATILEVKGNDINVEVEKLSMSLTKLDVEEHSINASWFHFLNNKI